MSTLLKAISDSDTVIMFTEGALFPNSEGVVKIGTEILSYAENYMGTLYGCVRGIQGSSAAAHAVGDEVTITDFFSGAGGGSGTFSTVTVTGLTASKAVVTDGSKALASSATSATELGYVAGVTSAIQTQLDAKAALSQLKVFQVVFASATTNFQTTSDTFQITNLTATITPTSTSHRILVMAYGTMETLAAKEGNFSIFRGATNLGNANGFGDVFIPGGAANVPVSIFTVDSPASVAALTYSMQIKNSDGVSLTKFGINASYLQTMILVEVA